MTPCRLLLDAAADGAWNMAADEVLLDQASETGRPTLRFYTWREATISLGYFQPHARRFEHAASSRCPFVRRLTGGGAIVHDAELTYSIALPAGHPLALRTQDLYRAVHDELVATLAPFGARAEICDAGAGLEASREPFLCFQRRAVGDVIVDGEKIAGSAQRRRQGAVLQHGSVLLQTSPAAPELPGLEAIAGVRLTPRELADLWGVRLRKCLDLQWLDEPWSDAEISNIQELRRRKYAAEVWNQRR